MPQSTQILPSLAMFPWPAPSGVDAMPRWADGGFSVGHDVRGFLGYGDYDSGWSDELTAMHEAEASSTHPIDVASRHMAIASMRLLAPHTDRVLLDIGCSSGFLVDALRQAFPRAGVIGADYLKATVDAAARRLQGVPFLQFDLRCCPLADQCIDGITALNVLEHIDDDTAALQHIFRILKPGGLAHIEVPASPASFDLHDEVLMHHRRYSLRALVAMAEQAGFVVRQATHLGFFVFPAFRWVKRRNQQRAKMLSPAEKRAAVAADIRQTGGSRLLAPIFRVERWLGAAVSYPIGIRAVVRLERPVC